MTTDEADRRLQRDDGPKDAPAPASKPSPEGEQTEASARAPAREAPKGGASGPIEPLRLARRGAAAAFEREYVRVLLRKSGGNITRAAVIAEVSRQMIQKLIRKHGL